MNRYPATRFSARSCLSLVLVIFVCSTNGLGQNTQLTGGQSSIRTAAIHSWQLPGSLANLPEADTITYVNLRRILNEAVPKLLPEKDVAAMRSAFDEMKRKVDVDPSKVDYLVIAVRSRKPAADLTFIPPEFMLIASGDFSADQLVALAKNAVGDKLRDEKYGSKTLGVLDLAFFTPQVKTNPLLNSFSELALASLNANTIAVGTTQYLKAAVDAAEGRGHVATETLNSLLRDPSSLVSLAGSPLTSFSKSFGLLGTEAHARTNRCDSKFGDFYIAVNMDAANFMLRGAMNADNPDTAKIIKGLLSGLLQQTAGSVPDKTAQSVLQGMFLTAQENEVVLRADIPQQMVVDFIHAQMKPKQQVSTPVTTPAPAKRRVTTRRRRP